MSYCLVLLHNRLVALAVFSLYGCLSTIVEEELCLVEVSLLACKYIELAESHLGNLVSWHHTHLSGLCANLTAHAVGISASDVEELSRTSGLEVCHSTFHHVSEVVELVAEVFHLRPTLVASPLVWVLGVHGA